VQALEGLVNAREVAHRPDLPSRAQLVKSIGILAAGELPLKRSALTSRPENPADLSQSRSASFTTYPIFPCSARGGGGSIS